jgi:hypothetical protein
MESYLLFRDGTSLPALPIDTPMPPQMTAILTSAPGSPLSTPDYSAQATALASENIRMLTRQAEFDATVAAYGASTAQEESERRERRVADATVAASYGGLFLSTLSFFGSTYFSWKLMQKEKSTK